MLHLYPNTLHVGLQKTKSSRNSTSTIILSIQLNNSLPQRSGEGEGEGGGNRTFILIRYDVARVTIPVTVIGKVLLQENNGHFYPHAHNRKKKKENDGRSGGLGREGSGIRAKEQLQPLPSF